MRQQVFKYLKSYSTLPLDVDRLIVSAYLSTNNISVKENKLINFYNITPSNEVEYQNLLTFINVIKKEISSFDLEALIQLFEFVISPSDRIINGAIYTPQYIRSYITEKAIVSQKDDIKKIRLVDISCGCGGFLLTAATRLKQASGLSYQEIFKNNIYGLDIQDYSINRTKILLSLLALSEGEDIKEFDFNLFTDDALTFNWSEVISDYSGFDAVLGNPPYVCARNLSKETALKIKRFEVCNSGNSDLYIPFFQIGIENLKPSGILGFITMNSFFKSLNGRNLREYFKLKSLKLQIIDFGTEQVFKSKNTYTCICIVQYLHSNNIQYCKSKSTLLPSTPSQFSEIPYVSLQSKTGWNLNDYEKILKIESTGSPFGSLYKTRHGIATLKNDVYIFKPIKEDKNFYYLDKDYLFPIEKEICRDVINANKLNRDIGLNSLKEKIIFPYDNQNKPSLLEEAYIKEKFPNTYNYLLYKKSILETRDKGEGKYENWYAFGRTQSLERVKNKLFFPKMANKTPNYVINLEESLLFYNGQAVIGHTKNEMIFIKKLMESRLFWYYIKTTSKPYSSNYYSFNGNYVNNFGICSLSDPEMEYVLNETNKINLDIFFESKYDIEIVE